MKTRKIAIVCNGEINDYEWLLSELLQYDTIIAANGGSGHLQKIQLVAHILIGDQDSIEQPVHKDTMVISFPEDKDASDMELAINHAITLSPSEIDIFGGMGGRYDHQFCNIMVLTNYRKLITIRTEQSNMQCISDGQTVEIIQKENAANIVTIMPVEKTAEVTTCGLLYQMENEILERGSRGLSNIMINNSAAVMVHSGTVILFHSWETV